VISTGPLADEESHDYAFCLAALRGALSELVEYLPAVLAGIPDGENLRYGATGSALMALNRGNFSERVLSPDPEELAEMKDFVRGCIALTSRCSSADDAIACLRDRFPPAPIADGDAMELLRSRRNSSYLEVLREVARFTAQMIEMLDARELHEQTIHQQEHRKSQVRIIHCLEASLG
jgi:hypothetical protein